MPYDSSNYGASLIKDWLDTFNPGLSKDLAGRMAAGFGMVRVAEGPVLPRPPQFPTGSGMSRIGQPAAAGPSVINVIGGGFWGGGAQSPPPGAGGGSGSGFGGTGPGTGSSGGGGGGGSGLSGVSVDSYATGTAMSGAGFTILSLGDFADQVLLTGSPLQLKYTAAVVQLGLKLDGTTLRLGVAVETPTTSVVSDTGAC